MTIIGTTGCNLIPLIGATSVAPSLAIEDQCAVDQSASDSVSTYVDGCCEHIRSAESPSCGMLTAPSQLETIAFEDPAGTPEFYTERPSILSDGIEPVRLESNEIPAEWDRIKDSFFYAAAELLSLHPGDEIYFIGRDAEYLYDVSLLLVRDNPIERARLHLINVSVAVSSDETLDRYLQENGLSRERLELLRSSGRRAITVDVGFHGTIYRTIAARIPDDLRNAIAAHDLVSCSSNIPSSRVYLGHLAGVNPNLKLPFEHWGDIKYTIEDLPHFTAKATEYMERSGRMVPASRGAAIPAKRARARALMSDIKATFDNYESRSLFRRTRQQIASVRHLIRTDGTGFDHGTLELALALEAQGLSGIINDLIDMHLSRNREKPTDEASDGVDRAEVTNATMEELIVGKKGGISDVIEAMAASPVVIDDTGNIAMLKLVATVCDSDNTCFFIKHVLSQPQFARHSVGLELLEAVLGKSSWLTPGFVDSYVLTQPAWRENPRLLELGNGGTPGASELVRILRAGGRIYQGVE